MGLPVEWLPWSSADAASQASCYPPGTQLPKQSQWEQFYDVVTRIGAGQGASLHCLQQAWKLWVTDSDWDITASLFMRATTS